MAAKYPTLALTTPQKRGKSVKLLQYLLRHNRYGQDFLKGSIDGVYGAQTAAAVRRAKYWVGYPSDKLNGIATDSLFRWLFKVGHPNFAALPSAYRLRRKLRLQLRARQAASAHDRVDALKVAITQLGRYETDANQPNKILYSDWYGMRGPWCAMFISWAFHKVGAAKKFRYAYCPYVWEDARRGRNGLSVVSSRYAKAGDLILFNWGSGEAKHIGIVEKNLGGGRFQTIEGNTARDASGNQSNGGGVYRRTRTLGDVLGFVRVA